MFTLSIGRRKPANDAQDTTAVLVGLLKQTTDERDKFVAIAERQLQELELRGQMIAAHEQHHEELHREIDRIHDAYEAVSTSSAVSLRAAAAEVAEKEETIGLLRQCIDENGLADPTTPAEDGDTAKPEAGSQEPVTV